MASLLQSASDIARNLFAKLQTQQAPIHTKTNGAISTQVVPRIVNTASNIGHTVAQQPIFSSPVQGFKMPSPTVGQVANNFVMPTLQAIPRSFIEAKQTPILKNIIPGMPLPSTPILPKGPISQAILGKTPLQSFTDTTRPAGKFLKGAGASPTAVKLGTPALALAGAVASDIPGGAGEKKIAEIATDPIQKIIQALSAAKPLQKEQQALYSAERSKRIGAVVGVGKNVSGEKGYFAQLSQLKGELPKVNFESIRKSVTQPDIDSFFNTVEQSHLTPFEKITAKTGLSKLLGAEGGTVPTKGEINLLHEVFPKEFTQAILAKRPLMQRLFSTAVDTLNVPRAIMATADLSAPLRQGAFLIGRPKQFLPAFGQMFKYAGSEKAYQGLMEDIQARPTYRLMRENKLALTDMGENLSKREESFMSTLPQRVPLFGSVVKGSNRAYAGFLNKLRADTFDSLISASKAQGVNTPKVNSDISNFVNTATGRGDLGKFSQAAELLNATLFAPRLVASRVNLLNPLYYTKLDPFVRKEALKSLIGFAGTGLTVLGAAKLGGAQVEADPRNADFGKIKIGNTRLDIWAGFQQYIKLAAQLATGKIISSTTGREVTLGQGYKPLTRKDIILRFLQSKESPVAGFISALATGQSGTGEPINVPAEVISRFIPLLAQDIYDLYKSGGLQATPLAIPGALGVGSQTYGQQELTAGQNEFGKTSTEVRGVPDLPTAISEKVFGKQPIQSSAGYNVEAYYNQLLKMPKAEAAAKFDTIIKQNPDLAKKIIQVIKDKQLGVTVKDQEVRALGVSSGERATAIAKAFKDLPDNQAKAKLWDDWVKKKIITADIAKQLMQMKQAGTL